VESGQAPTPTTTEPGRTTVQLLVASSAILALLQLVASTSVDVYNGQRAGWWVAIQGTTVAFAAAFAGAAAASNGAWWRRMQEKSGSTTPSSLGTGVACASVAGAVFAVLCWAASSLGNASSPMGIAVLVAALLGGIVGSARIGGAVLAGLVATFIATLINLAGQVLATMFQLTPAISSNHGGDGGTPTFNAIFWAVSTVVGTSTGIWWLARRRQRTGISHALVVGIFPGLLLAAGSVGGLIAWALVDDPAKDEALDQAIGSHGLQLGISLACGVVAAVVALRTVHLWHKVPGRLGAALGRSRSAADADTGEKDNPGADASTGPPEETQPTDSASAQPEATADKATDRATERADSAAPDPQLVTTGASNPARTKPDNLRSERPGRHRANGRTLPTGAPASSDGGNGTPAKGRLTRLIPTQGRNRSERATKSSNG
jgi:hypothetical protein